MAKDIDRLTLLGKKDVLFPAGPGKAEIETFENEYAGRGYRINLDCLEFSCLCPKTGQPDFGVLKISYIPDKKCIETKSLKLYLFSYRNFGIFNEEVVNKILDRLVDACKPLEMEVIGVFNTRGGIQSTVEAGYRKQTS